MFYKALGFAVWKLGKRYIQLRFPNYRRVAAGVALFTAALGAGYLFTREPQE